MSLINLSWSFLSTDVLKICVGQYFTRFDLYQAEINEANTIGFFFAFVCLLASRIDILNISFKGSMQAVLFLCFNKSRGR